MKVGLFSDIHSNLSALEAVIAFFKKNPCDEYYCLGDVVGYGPQPDECCTLVRDFAKATILGNHDAAVCGRMDYAYYYDSARSVLDYHASILSRDNMRWLSDLPYTLKHEAGFTLSHGSPLSPKDFNYIFTIEQALQHVPHFDELDHINFIGHSHLTKSFAITPNSANDITANILHFEEGKKYFSTVGSVGQPRDHFNEARCTIYDSDTKTHYYHKVPYNIEDTVRKLFASDITYNFGKRLYLGI